MKSNKRDRDARIWPGEDPARRPMRRTVFIGGAGSAKPRGWPAMARAGAPSYVSRSPPAAFSLTLGVKQVSRGIRTSREDRILEISGQRRQSAVGTSPQHLATMAFRARSLALFRRGYGPRTVRAPCRSRGFATVSDGTQYVPPLSPIISLSACHIT